MLLHPVVEVFLFWEIRTSNVAEAEFVGMGKEYIFLSRFLGVMARGLILPLDFRPNYYNYLQHKSIVSMLCHTYFKDWPNAILPTKLSHFYFLYHSSVF